MHYIIPLLIITAIIFILYLGSISARDLFILAFLLYGSYAVFWMYNSEVYNISPTRDDIFPKLDIIREPINDTYSEITKRKIEASDTRVSQYAAYIAGQFMKRIVADSGDIDAMWEKIVSLDDKQLIEAAEIHAKTLSDKDKLKYLYIIDNVWKVANIGHTIDDAKYEDAKKVLDDLVEHNQLPETIMNLYIYDTMLNYGIVMNTSGRIVPNLHAITKLKARLLK